LDNILGVDAVEIEVKVGNFYSGPDKDSTLGRLG